MLAGIKGTIEEMGTNNFYGYDEAKSLLYKHRDNPFGPNEAWNESYKNKHILDKDGNYQYRYDEHGNISSARQYAVDIGTPTEANRNAEHYLYAYDQVRQNPSILDQLQMELYTGGYSLYKRVRNFIQGDQSPFKYSEPTNDEVKSGTRGVADAVIDLEREHEEVKQALTNILREGNPNITDDEVANLLSTDQKIALLTAYIGTSVDIPKNRLDIELRKSAGFIELGDDITPSAINKHIKDNGLDWTNQMSIEKLMNENPNHIYTSDRSDGLSVESQEGQDHYKIAAAAGLHVTIDDKAGQDLISIINDGDRANSDNALKGARYNTMIADIDHSNRYSWVDEENPARLYSINIEDNTLTITEEGTTVTIPDFNNGDMGIYLNGLDHLLNKDLEMLKRQELEESSRNRALEAHTHHQELMQDINAREQNPEHLATPLSEAKALEDPEQQPMQQGAPQHDLSEVDTRQAAQQVHAAQQDYDRLQAHDGQQIQAEQSTQDLSSQETAPPQADYAYSAYNSALDERIPEPTNEIAIHRVDRDEEIKMFGGYKLGDQHPEIKELQALLNEAMPQKGFEIPEDGRFSRDTQSRLQSAQMRCGLEPTGIADGLTIDRLKESLLDKEEQLALKAERAATAPSVTLYERSALGMGVTLYQADAVLYGQFNKGVEDQFDLTYYERGSNVPGVRVASINGLSQHEGIGVSEQLSQHELALGRERELARENNRSKDQDGPNQGPERS